MKTYTIPQLKALAGKQGYKMAALEDSNGIRILPFNQAHKVTIAKHLEKIPQRLDSEIRQDGVYYVLMAHNIQGSKTPDRYPIVKGKVEPEVLAEVEKRALPLTRAEIVNQEPSVRGWDAALADKEKIAMLSSELERVKAELNTATAKIEELEAELEEEPEQLSEQQANPTVSFLKEQVPALLPILDRYFDLQEKKIGLEERRLNGAARSAPAARKPGSRPLVPGSAAHLQVIRMYFNSGNDDKMNAELDKLEEANPEVYAQIIAELGLEPDNEQEQNEEGQV
jgi:uncharacterized small protein (DUF1192 family)